MNTSRLLVALALTSALVLGCNGGSAQDCTAIDAFADLQGCDFTGADLEGAYLWSANLTNANLTDADLTGANLTDVNLTGATMPDGSIHP
jgi:uncharacterized protein YjbI with pentapeptide repeats